MNSDSLLSGLKVLVVMRLVSKRERGLYICKLVNVPVDGAQEYAPLFLNFSGAKQLLYTANGIQWLG